MWKLIVTMNLPKEIRRKMFNTFKQYREFAGGDSRDVELSFRTKEERDNFICVTCDSIDRNEVFTADFKVGTSDSWGGGRTRKGKRP